MDKLRSRTTCVPPRASYLAHACVLVPKLPMQIARMANAFHMKVIPHASIGIGIFQAAGLHAAAALPNCPMHEYQHSVFDRNLQYVQTSMGCAAGAFALPDGPGLGIEPADSLWQFLCPKN